MIIDDMMMMKIWSNGCEVQIKALLPLQLKLTPLQKKDAWGGDMENSQGDLKPSVHMDNKVI